MPTTIETLAVALYDAKKAEDAAKEARVALEEEIAALVETPENGSKTVTAGALKVTVKRGFSYKADVQAILGLGLADPPLKTKIELNEKAYEEIRESDPGLYARISKFVTVTPRKVAVMLKLA
jgi:hypothetical protein